MRRMALEALLWATWLHLLHLCKGISIHRAVHLLADHQQRQALTGGHRASINST